MADQEPIDTPAERCIDMQDRLESRLVLVNPSQEMVGDLNGRHLSLHDQGHHAGGHVKPSGPGASGPATVCSVIVTVFLPGSPLTDS